VAIFAANQAWGSAGPSFDFGRVFSGAEHEFNMRRGLRTRGGHRSWRRVIVVTRCRVALQFSPHRFGDEGPTSVRRCAAAARLMNIQALVAVPPFSNAFTPL